MKARGVLMTRSRTGLLCAIAALGTLAFGPSALALQWDATDCLGAKIRQCPQVGTPTKGCECGLWADAPGAGEETGLAFVRSGTPDDETGVWIAELATPVPLGPNPGEFNELFVRMAINDGTEVKLLAYGSKPEAGDLCRADEQKGAYAVITATSTESKFESFKAPITHDDDNMREIDALCLIVSDEGDDPGPQSKRSTALIRTIKVRNSNDKNTVKVLERFRWPN